MTAALKMLSPATCEVIDRFTSSPESADGLLPFVLPDGRTISPSGLVAALASLSARQVRELGLRMSGIYGPPCTTWSASASLQSSLESRLQQRLGTAGLIESSVTWKASVTHAGVRYCKRVAQTRPTSATDSGSLPTPSGTSNHGKNHVAGRLDEWGGSSNPFRGTSLGRVHCPAFELWVMGYPRNVGGCDAARNAIVPQVAAEFIRAYVEAREGLMVAA